MKREEPSTESRSLALQGTVVFRTSTAAVFGCVTCRCVVGQDRWDYTQCTSTQPVNPGSNCKSCEVDGVCRAFGDIFQKDCFTYECRPYGNSWRAEVVKAGCKDADGYCRASGSYMPYIQHGQRYENCMCTAIGTSARYQCEGTTGTTTRCTGCKVDGVCHSVNSKWTKDCLTYQCKQLGSFWVFANIVSAQCKDAYGHCRNHNEHMSAVIGGYTFNNCVCLINGLQISHQCSS